MPARVSCARPRRTRAATRAALAAGAAVVLVALIAGCSGGSSSSPASSSENAGASGFDGAALPAGVVAPPFALTDQRGRRVSLAGYRGHVAIIAFVYSTCGATCVVIAEQIRGALDELPRPVPVLLVSANTRADTPASVRRFLARVSLSGRVSYLSGSPEQLRPVWRAFRVTPAAADRAAFDRSAAVFVIDRSGHERVIYQLEQLTPEGLAHDVRKLLG